MKNIYFYLLLILLFQSNSLCFSQEIEGYFYVDGGGLDIYIRNKENIPIVIEGLEESLLNANFFNSEGEKIQAKHEIRLGMKSFQNWTRLLGASPDGTNSGSICRVIVHSLEFPRKEKSGIKYLVFRAEVLLIGPDRRLSLPKEVEVRLGVKSRDNSGKRE